MLYLIWHVSVKAHCFGASQRVNTHLFVAFCGRMVFREAKFYLQAKFLERESSRIYFGVCSQFLNSQCFFFFLPLFSASITIELLRLVASRMKGTCLMILFPCCTYSSCIQSHLIHNNPGCFTHICASVLYAVHTVLLSVFLLKCLSKTHDWSLSKHIAGVMLVVHSNLA